MFDGLLLVLSKQHKRINRPKIKNSFIGSSTVPLLCFWLLEWLVAFLGAWTHRQSRQPIKRCNDTGKIIFYQINNIVDFQRLGQSATQTLTCLCTSSVFRRDVDDIRAQRGFNAAILPLLLGPVISLKSADLVHVKVQFTREQDTRAKRGSRGIALLFL